MKDHRNKVILVKRRVSIRSEIPVGTAIERTFDVWLTANGGRDLLLLMEFMQQRAKESQRWSDSVLKSVVTESEHNANQIRAWISTWRIRAQEALAPLANALLCEQALAEAFSVLEQRLGKVGLGH